MAQYQYYDATMFDQKWFRELTVENKLAWLFLFTKSDPIGVVADDRSIAEVTIGSVVDWDAFFSKVRDRIFNIGCDQLWVPDRLWCTMRSRTFNGSNPFHIHAYKLLRERELVARIQEFFPGSLIEEIMI